MPSAKKTPNYNLTQYADNGTDKVSFMGDYNIDMSKIDTALNDNANNIITKADKATTYTKTDVDGKLGTKADKATTYTKSDIDGKVTTIDDNIGTKADKATTYTKRDIDGKVTTINDNIGTKADKTTTYTKSDIDGKVAPLQNTVPYGFSVLCSYFLSTSERLYYSISADGINFSDPYVRRNDAGENVRDPSCVYINGQVYFTWTRPTESGGGAFGTTNTIAVAQLNSTTGEINRNIITPQIPGQTIANLWAPDFYLEGSTLYIIFSVKTNTSDFVAYEIHATSDYANPGAYSSPRSLGIPAYAGIDHHIIKDDAGTYHDISADGSIISHRSSKTLVGGWSAREVVDGSWRYLEAPASYKLSNGKWRVFFDGGGLQGDYNPGSKLPENDGLMFYADFSNDLSSHSNLQSIPHAMRHCGLTLIPSNYIKGQSRLESGSSFGGALLTLDKDITNNTINPTGKWIPQWTKCETFGAVKNTGFGPPNNATQGVIVEQSGLYLLSASISMGNLTPNSWLNGYFQYYPKRDVDKVVKVGNGLAGAQAFKAPDGDTITTLVMPAIPVLLQAGDEVNIVLNGLAQSGASMRQSNCYFSVVKVG